MRPSYSERVERGRLVGDPRFPSIHGDQFGWFKLTPNGGKRAMIVIASNGTDEVPWEHVSVSYRDRCPTWEEMAWIKSLFWEDEEAVIQYHPRKSQYISHHPFCLHLWRPLFAPVPEPPTVAVGPRPGEPVYMPSSPRFGLKQRG